MDRRTGRGEPLNDSPTTLITGASRGIGLATAELLAGRGDRVVLVARSASSLDVACERIRARGGEAWSCPGDVSDAGACGEVVRRAIAVAGAIDIAVMAAGIGHWVSTMEMTEAQWRDTMAVNLDGVYYTTRAVLPGMLEGGRGHLVFVSSVLGRKGVPNMSAYRASKAAVAAFAESVAAEVKPHGVKVTVVYPGTTATTMREHQERRPKTPDITDPDLQLAPEDVADAIAWATRVSDRAYPTAVTVEPRGLAAAPRADLSKAGTDD